MCWAHLMRDFLGVQQWGQPAKEVGAALYRQAKHMFRLWHLVRDGTISRAEFTQKVDRQLVRNRYPSSTSAVFHAVIAVDVGW